MLDLNRKSYAHVPETLAPQSGNKHPVTEQRFVKGGHHQFQSVGEMNDLDLEKREPFMTCVVKGVSYILSENLSQWSPFDRGYLVLNPKKPHEIFYLVLPFDYVILAVTTHSATVHSAITQGRPNERKTLVISGSEGSVATLEIARIYVA